MQKKSLWILIIWIACAVGISAGETPWKGKWHVFWQEGAFVLQLEQHGNDVKGTYQPNDGILKGRVDGKHLKGISVNRQGTNRFVFTLSPDENAFFGNMQSGDWIAGSRVTVQQGISRTVLNTSHPFTTMYAFLKLGNQIRNGNYEVQEKVLDLLLLSPVQQKYFYGKRLSLVRKFLQTIDLCTVHKYDFPNKIEGNRVSVPFHQAGTGNTFTVTFVRKNSASGWKIELPPETEMDTVRKKLMQAYGLTEIDPESNLKLSTPRDTMRTFIEQNERWERGGKQHVLDTLNLSAVDPSIWEWQAPLLAHYLLGVINRVSDFVYQEIPNNPKSRMPYVYFYHPLGSIVIAPFEVNGKIHWQFTPETLENIEQLYEAMEEVTPKVHMVVKGENSLYFTLKH